MKHGSQSYGAERTLTCRTMVQNTAKYGSIAVYIPKIYTKIAVYIPKIYPKIAVYIPKIYHKIAVYIPKYSGIYIFQVYNDFSRVKKTC